MSPISSSPTRLPPSSSARSVIVVNEDGDVVGIVYASSRERAGTGFATDDTELRRALDSRSATEVAKLRAKPLRDPIAERERILAGRGRGRGPGR